MKQSWPPGDTEMARRIREYDWAGTSFGSIEHWSSRLRHHVETMLASKQAIAIVCAPDSTMVYNDACATALGAKHPCAFGNAVRESFVEIIPALTEYLSQAFAGEAVEAKTRPFDLEGPRPRSSDTFDMYLTPVREDDGTVAYVHAVGFKHELAAKAESALRDSEERQAFLLRLSDTLRPLADPIEIQKSAMRVLGVHLKANRVAYTQITDKEYIIGADYVDGVPSMAGRYRIDSFGPNKIAAYQEGVTRIVPDAQSDTFNDPAAVANFAALGVRAGLGVPLFKNGRMVATLVVHQREPRNWTIQDVALAEETAECTWAALERARAEAALRESEQKYRSLFENLGQGYAECELIRDPEGHVTDFRYIVLNPAFERLTGLKIEGMIGRTAREAVPELADSHFEKYERIVAAGLPSREEYRIDALDRWFENHVYPGGNDRFFSLYDDISDRKRAEAALRESEDRLTAAFESVPVGVAVIDMSGKAVLANPEYLRFLPSRVIPSRDPARLARWQAWDAEGQQLKPHNFPSARALRGETVVPGQEMLFTSEDGREFWTSVATAPIRDEQEQVTGAVSVISDIDAAKRSVTALRESEERLRQFGDASQDILWIRDAKTLQWQYLTPAFEAVYGLSRDEALSGDDYRNWQALIVPEDRDRAVASIERVLGGEQVTFDYRIRRPADGQIRWLRNTDFPIRDPDGRIILIGGVGHDLTEHFEAERRLQTLIEGIPQLVWRASKDGQWTWSSPQWTAMSGLTNADSIDDGWLDAVHPDDRETAVAAWHQAPGKGFLDMEGRIRDTQANDYRWFRTRATPVRDQDGSIIEWLGTSTDIHDIRELQERQQVLVAELQHRTRNLMGVIRSVADKTEHSSADLTDFRARFRARLDALARVQGLLSRLNEHDRVTFDEVVETEIKAMGTAGDKITLDGPKGIRLRSSTVQTLALALHELATNATKYGAMKEPAGHLSIRWSYEQRGPDGRPWLHIDWRETGVAISSNDNNPKGTGQGRELIERALPYQLKAKVTFVLTPDGVHCTISLPVSSTVGSIGGAYG